MRPIDADALKEKAWDAETRCGFVQVVDVGDIDAAPTIDPVKHGKWTKHTLPDCTYFICSLCGWESIDSKSIYDDDGWYVDEVGMAYCPNCGAKMDVPDNDFGKMEGSEE